MCIFNMHVISEIYFLILVVSGCDSGMFLEFPTSHSYEPEPEFLKAIPVLVNRNQNSHPVWFPAVP